MAKTTWVSWFSTWSWRNSPGCLASSPGTSTRAIRAGSDAAWLVLGSRPSPAPYGLMSAFRTPGSGTVASALGTARIDCSTPPFPLPVMTRPAYSGPEPANGVTIIAKAVPLRDPGARPSSSTTLWWAGTWKTLLVAAWALLPSAIWVTRAWTARPGAESTSAVASPPPVTLSATTPCSWITLAPAVNVPAPPGTSMAAVTGSLDETSRAPGIADSDGSDSTATEPPGMSRLLPPVGS